MPTARILEPLTDGAHQVMDLGFQGHPPTHGQEITEFPWQGSAAWPVDTINWDIIVPANGRY